MAAMAEEETPQLIANKPKQGYGSSIIAA